jgi:CubicO group peptidase (beta-lactamase class C family)
MKKILQFVSVILSIFLIYTLVLNSQDIRRLYHLNNAFEANNIRENFRNMYGFFTYNEVQASESSSEIRLSDSDYQLPDTFLFDNFDVSINYFLRYTNTNALLIMHNDELVYKNYFNTQEATDDSDEIILPRNDKDLFIGWSISKSIVSLLTAIAIEQGDIEGIDDLASKYIPQLGETAFKETTIRQLLQMVSGVAFDEDYDNFFSDINVFSYYLALGLPMSDFIFTLVENDHKGEHYYATVETQVLAMILNKVTNKSLTTLLQENIWQPGGMEHNALWISDSTGMEFAGGGFNASAIDYARIGQLIANNGILNNKQIAPATWIENLGKKDYMVSTDDYEDYDYSYHWWIPHDTKENEVLAIGVYDQYIYINRDKNLVIVKLSANAHYISDDYISEKQSLAFFRTISEKF